MNHAQAQDLIYQMLWMSGMGSKGGAQRMAGEIIDRLEREGVLHLDSPREALKRASERAMAQPGAKWTPATGWTDEPIVPADTLRAAHYRGEHDAGVTQTPDPAYVPGCPACDETQADTNHEGA